jgi:uncharacterized membrane protein YuzA (DUF378 family)
LIRLLSAILGFVFGLLASVVFIVILLAAVVGIAMLIGKPRAEHSPEAQSSIAVLPLLYRG